MPVASWILLLFSLGSIAGNTALAKPVELNLKGFRESSRILVGKLPIRVAPRREYLIKAGASGLIELYVPPKPGNFKAGDRLGGIDVQRLELDEELMTLSESLLKEKEIPQWHLQRKAQVDQLTTQLTALEGERELAENMLADPQKYKDLFKGMRKGREMGGRDRADARGGRDGGGTASGGGAAGGAAGGGGHGGGGGSGLPASVVPR